MARFLGLLVALLLAAASASGLRLLERRVLADFPRPPYREYARMCRWLAHVSDWGTLATADAATGAPYGGVVSVSDGPPGAPSGRLYFYLTPMDRTTQNIDASEGGGAALVLAEAARLPGGCGGPDPESPVCAKATVLGGMRRLEGPDADAGLGALVARHPEMASWPKDHGFRVYVMDIREIHLLDFFGGMHVVTPQDYYAADLAPSSS